MTFETMITLYYLCDQAAAHRGLTPTEVTHCMANYERLKLGFVEEVIADPGSVERAAQIRLGYRAFKDWEAANAETVAGLRARARAKLGLG